MACLVLVQDRFPVLALFDFDRLKDECEPVRYNYTRENVSYDAVMKEIQRDATS
jgi:hypothetical protein